MCRKNMESVLFHKLSTEKKIDRFYKFCIFWGSFCFFFGKISFFNQPDHDMFHEMALARESLNLGFIPNFDLYSYIPTLTPVVHHEWGTGAILYFITVHLHLGGHGLIVLKYSISLIIFLLCYLFLKKHKIDTAICALLGIIAIAMGWIGFATIRAQLFTLLFLVIMIHLLDVERQGKKWWVVILIPLFIMWLNMHAGFLVGVGYYIFHSLDRLLKKYNENKNMIEALKSVLHLFIILLIMVILIPVNPFGLDYITYLWRAIFLDRTNLISEWQPMWQFDKFIFTYNLIFFGLSLLLLIYSAIKDKNYRSPILLLLFVLAYQTIFHLRQLSIYAIFWICFLPLFLYNTAFYKFLIRFKTNMKHLLVYFWIILGILGIYLSIQNQFWRLTFNQKDYPYPCGVVDYLKTYQFRGNLMTPFREGAYISWKLYPQVKVSMDSRYEVAYRQENVIENINFYKGMEKYSNLLCKHSTDGVLIPKSAPLYDKMKGDNKFKVQDCTWNWLKVYSDDMYVLFIKENLAINLPEVDKTGQTILMDFP